METQTISICLVPPSNKKTGYGAVNLSLKMSEDGKTLTIDRSVAAPGSGSLRASSHYVVSAEKYEESIPGATSFSYKFGTKEYYNSVENLLKTLQGAESKVKTRTEKDIVMRASQFLSDLMPAPRSTPGPDRSQ